MKYQLIKPPSHLETTVRHFWILESEPHDSKLPAFKTFVDDSSGIIFEQGGGVSSFVNEQGRLPKLFLYGQSTRPTLTHCEGKFSVTGVALRPHALYKLTGVDASEFTDRLVELNNFSDKAFEEKLCNAKGHSERIKLLSEFLHARQHKADEDNFVNDSLRYIYKHKGALTIAQVLRQMNTSERKLERHFDKVVGVRPKFFMRVIRFQEALRKMRMRRHDKLLDVALDSGYYDQSHFIREMKLFSGYSPKMIEEEVKEVLLNLAI